MDRLPSTTVASGIINVKGINLLSDSAQEKVYIPFAYDSFKDKVQTSVTAVGKDVNNEYQTTTFAPIFKYNVSYNPNNVSSKTVQSSNDTVFLGNRLNILTPQQIAQRANSNHAGSKSKSFCCKVSSPSIEKYSLR